MYAEFTENLVTGNEMIDSQHKELIEKINGLMRSCETNAELAVAVKTLNYLADYTEFHFSAEEKLQEEIEDEQMKAVEAALAGHDVLGLDTSVVYFSTGKLKYGSYFATIGGHVFRTAS